MQIVKGFSGDLDEAWGLAGPEKAVEQAGVRVVDRAEDVTDKLEVLIIKAECLKTICARRYISCQVEIERVLSEWDR